MFWPDAKRHFPFVFGPDANRHIPANTITSYDSSSKLYYEGTNQLVLTYKKLTYTSWNKANDH